MDIRYRRERNENYMLIGAEEPECQGYQARMLEKNHIGGLLRFRVEQINGQTECCYTISGRQAMAQRFGGVTIPLDQIRLLMEALSKTTGQLEEYLLDIDRLLLEPEFIFWKEDSDPEFCYYPGTGDNHEFRENLRNLLRYILKRIDYKDDVVVAAAYGIYRIGTKDNFRMLDILKFLYNDVEMGKRIQCQEPGVEEKPARKRQIQKKGTSQTVKPATMEEDHELCGSQGMAAWVDRLFIFMVVGLATAAIGILLLKQYQKRDYASEKEWIVCFSVIVMITAVSIGMTRLLLGRTGKAADGEAGKEEMEVTQGQPMGEDLLSGDIYNDICNKEAKAYGRVRESESYFAREGVLGMEGEKAAGKMAYFFHSLNQSQLPDFTLEENGLKVMLGNGAEPPGICLDWPTVSRKHAWLNVRNGICTVSDCGSRNGTYVDDIRLMPDEIHILLPGSIVRFADAAFRFEEIGEPETQLLAQEDGKCYTYHSNPEVPRP